MALVPNENSPAPDSYLALLREIKDRIRSAQYAALRAVNLELLSLYWDIGRLIDQQQQAETFGCAVVEKLGADNRPPDVALTPNGSIRRVLGEEWNSNGRTHDVQLGK